MFIDNQATIGLVKLNFPTARSRYLNVPIVFMHGDVFLGYYDSSRISRKLNVTDSSTKEHIGHMHQYYWKFHH